jgi:hypothetical protein
MKALDIYLAVCFFMVFGALLEYAIVSYTGKRIILHQRQFAEFKKKVIKLCRVQKEGNYKLPYGVRHV